MRRGVKLATADRAKSKGKRVFWGKAGAGVSHDGRGLKRTQYWARVGRAGEGGQEKKTGGRILSEKVELRKARRGAKPGQ